MSCKNCQCQNKTHPTSDCQSHKKPVHSSHLALRFYKRDGWTKDLIQKYLKWGEIKDTAETHGDSAELAYLFVDVGGQLEMKKFYDEQVSSVHRWHGHYENETDLQFLEDYNW